jgi:acetyl-CoA synthetase
MIPNATVRWDAALGEWEGLDMTTPDARIAQLLTRFAAPDACLARLMCDDHPADRVAFTIVEPHLSTHELTYGRLRVQSERFAASLSKLGVGVGDRVGVLMGKSEELIVALVAIWRLGAVHVPLFTAFAPPAIAMRLTAAAAKVVIVDGDQRAKLDPSENLRSNAPWQIVSVGGDREGDLVFDDLVGSEGTVDATAVGGDAPFILIFTSGTTGAPKGVPTPVRALAHMVAYIEYGFDVRPDDVYWCNADPGWAYGLFYAIAAPLAMGRPSILLHAGFSPELTWAVLAELQVSNYTAAPTVYRALRNAPGSVTVRLRCASSAGEPLTPDLIPWAETTLGAPVRDHYGQTELGMVVVNGWHADIRRDIKPGSMGHAMPGHRVTVLGEDRDEPAPPGTLGRVAVDTSAPLFAFGGYHDAADKTAERLTADGRWYLTGDTATIDNDGALFFSSRDDDVIIMAGYRIGPFDVESVLVTHPDVAEAAVVGVRDELRGEVLEAFVVLRSGVGDSQELTGELQQLVKTKFAAHAFPRSVHYVDSLPKTPSGKIQRFLLRAQREDELAESQSMTDSGR